MAALISEAMKDFAFAIGSRDVDVAEPGELVVAVSESHDAEFQRELTAKRIASTSENCLGAFDLNDEAEHRDANDVTHTQRRSDARQVGQVLEMRPEQDRKVGKITAQPTANIVTGREYPTSAWRLREKRSRQIVIESATGLPSRSPRRLRQRSQPSASGSPQ